MKSAVVFCLGFFLLTGCQTALELPKPERFDDIKRVAPMAEQRRLAFAGGMFDLKRGDLYVAYPYWHWSVPNVNVGLYICNTGLAFRLANSLGYWDEDENIFKEEWADEGGVYVERTLARLGYDIKQRRRSFFQDQLRRPSAELLLSMRIIDMKMNLCYIHSPMVGVFMGRAGGNGVVTIEWEVFDTIREQILGSFITQGYGAVDEPLQAGDKALLMSAIQDAAENLGHSKWFHQIMTTMDPVDLIPPTKYQPMKLTSSNRTYYKPIQNQYSIIRRGVISVRAERSSHGAGFFLNNEGYALTSAGVVGDAKNVQIMDANGTKYQARVLRRDERRDVALIKADIKDNMALPISKSTWVNLAETVYAIGTPFSNSYRTTITKGIISARRYHIHNGMSYIQASISTAPGFGGGPLTDESGNVIGISTIQSTNAQESNFSLFVPIDEALKALNIQIEKETFIK